MNDYVDLVKEALEPVGPVRLQRMFGGYGLYHHELMFGLIAGGVLYLKADEDSAGSFRERGLAQFQYTKKGKPTKLSYFAAPEELFEDADEALLWASRAYDAAVRAAGRKRKTGRR